jgi:hypothetical protein
MEPGRGWVCGDCCQKIAKATQGCAARKVRSSASLYTQWIEPVGTTLTPKNQWNNALSYAPIDLLVASHRWGCLFPTDSVH